jgi:hypothetical protein
MSPAQADLIILQAVKEGRLSLLEVVWPLFEKTIHEESIFPPRLLPFPIPFLSHLFLGFLSSAKFINSGKLALIKHACEFGRPTILHLLISYLPSYEVPKAPSLGFFQKIITPIPPQAPAPHSELTAAILLSAQKGNIKCLRQMLAFSPIDLNTHARLAITNAYSYGKSECVKFLLGKDDKRKRRGDEYK